MRRNVTRHSFLLSFEANLLPSGTACFFDRRFDVVVSLLECTAGLAGRRGSAVFFLARAARFLGSFGSVGRLSS
jgi:hypothetical protein